MNAYRPQHGQSLTEMSLISVMVVLVCIGAYQSLESSFKAHMGKVARLENPGDETNGIMGMVVNNTSNGGLPTSVAVSLDADRNIIYSNPETGEPLDMSPYRTRPPITLPGVFD